MTVPKFDELMFPMLKFLSDKKKHSTKEINEYLINYFKLTPEDKTQRTPNGAKPLFSSKCDWAKFHLKKAGLITSPKRSIFEISEDGIIFLKSHENSFDRRTLMSLPSFYEFVEESEYQRQMKLKNNN